MLSFKGLILKDLYFVKNNLLIVILTYFLAIFFTILYKYNMNFILFVPFVIIMLCHSFFSEEEKSKWNTYISVLPVNKKIIIASKYISSILCSVFSTILSLLLSFLLSVLNDNILNNLLFSSIVYCCGTILFIAILYPMTYKFGADKGRIYFLITIIILTISINFGFKNIITFDFNNFNENINYSIREPQQQIMQKSLKTKIKSKILNKQNKTLDNNTQNQESKKVINKKKFILLIVFLLILLTIIFIGVSYIISYIIYKQKEF